MTSYAKSDNGIIHAVNPATPEFTLCGDSFDIGDTEDDAKGCFWKEVKRGPVTCPVCARVILGCRGIHVQKSLQSKKIL